MTIISSGSFQRLVIFLGISIAIACIGCAAHKAPIVDNGGGSFLCNGADAEDFLSDRHNIEISGRCTLSKNNRRLLCTTPVCRGGFSEVYMESRAELVCITTNNNAGSWRIQNGLECASDNTAAEDALCGHPPDPVVSASEYAATNFMDLSNCREQGRSGIRCEPSCQSGYDANVNRRNIRLRCVEVAGVKTWTTAPRFTCSPSEGECIPGSTLMTRCDGTTTRVDQLQPGDTVKCLEASNVVGRQLQESCCPISFWAHADASKNTSYVTLSTESGPVVSGSPGHLINVKAPDSDPTPGYEVSALEPSTDKWVLKRFEEVVVGDTLLVHENGNYVEATVTSTDITHEEGYYNPVLLSNAMYIANGVALSPFVGNMSYDGITMTKQDFWYAQAAFVTSTWDGSRTVLADFGEPAVGTEANMWEPWLMGIEDQFSYLYAFVRSPYEVDLDDQQRRVFVDLFVNAVAAALGTGATLSDRDIGGLRMQAAMQAAGAA